MMTPQVRARKLLESEGFIVETVEQTKRAGTLVWKTDLFGCFDLLAVNEQGSVKAVQVTSRSHVANRVKKIADSPVISRLRKCGWHLEVWGYGKTVSKGDWVVVDVS